ncbi:MAG: right-handed parallel beta-helix repeat-containing protein, partial [Fidelibacterota bacterium]
IDGNQNGSVVTFESGEDSSTVLMGFTLQNGFATSGGGIYCDNNSHPLLLDLYILNNTADDFGGGIYCSQNSNPTLKSSTISGNHVVSTGSNNDGGGVYCTGNANPLLENTTIEGNWALLGGGLLASGASPQLVNVIVKGNTGGYGGGLYCSNSQITLTNVLVTQNTAWYYGGAIHSINSDPLLVNVTVSGNTSDLVSGGLSCEGSNPVLINTILWENTSPEVYFSNLGGPNTLTVTYSDIQFGMDSIWTNNNGTINWLAGNIALDPRFVEPDSANFHLLETSYCIGAGIDSVEIDTSWYVAPTMDIEGNPRPNPTASAPDMGAYEHALAVPHTRQLVLTEDHHDFGTVQVDSLSSWSLTVFNEGNQPLTIVSIQHETNDFLLSDTTGIIAPDDSMGIIVICQPSRLGIIDDTLRIISNDTDDPDTLQLFPLQVIGIDTVAPNPPINLLAESSPLSIQVHWSPNPEGDLHHYNLYRSETSPADSHYATIYSPDSSFLDTAVILEQPYYYRLTAIDSVGNESGFSPEVVGVAINYPPQITYLTALTEEQHGLVPITIVSLDYEGDSVGYSYSYSLDSLQWYGASITQGQLRAPNQKKLHIMEIRDEMIPGLRNREGQPDTLRLQWDTNADLGEEYYDSVYFRVVATDYLDTTNSVTGPFPVDNFVGFLTVDQSDLGGEQSGNINIPFLIIDPTNDDYTITVEFSLQNSQSWQPATVPNL